MKEREEGRCVVVRRHVYEVYILLLLCLQDTCERVKREGGKEGVFILLLWLQDGYP